MKRYLIYALVDPRDSTIRYIGRSSSGVRRPYAHMAPSALRKDNTPKGKWIREIRAIGLRPSISVLEEFDTPEPLVESERTWIQRLKPQLFNVDPGGYPGPQAPIHSQRIAESHRKNGHRPTPEVIRLATQRAHEPEAIAKRLQSMGCKPFVDQNGNRYETIQEAATKLGLQKGNVHRVLNPGKYHYKQTGGYVFTYLT